MRRDGRIGKRCVDADITGDTAGIADLHVLFVRRIRLPLLGRCEILFYHDIVLSNRYPVLSRFHMRQIGDTEGDHYKDDPCQQEDEEPFLPVLHSSWPPSSTAASLFSGICGAVVSFRTCS